MASASSDGAGTGHAMGFGGRAPPSEEDAAMEPAEGEVPLLGPSTGDDPDIPVLKMGETLRLETMGPIIINHDGTTKTIDNWSKMTPAEQETTQRVIAARNKKRIAALEKEAAERGEEL
eukprot:CAMPEP_0194283060 /NCGR_PEP_ID=MMETSP0169-20130528/24593_1 /TAXON_ID=218684 /ORGANISM="Corethron pennatum, Strain L29A3" /LENGTH=118 /DNA_ID=CAMNT_0039028579 /DNA_START=225 /DNA_END=581 /DNA_ORIENTATION=+